MTNQNLQNKDTKEKLELEKLKAEIYGRWIALGISGAVVLVTISQTIIGSINHENNLEQQNRQYYDSVQLENQREIRQLRVKSTEILFENKAQLLGDNPHERSLTLDIIQLTFSPEINAEILERVEKYLESKKEQAASDEKRQEIQNEIETIEKRLEENRALIIGGYLDAFNIGIHFKSDRGDDDFNIYHECAKEIRDKLVTFGTINQGKDNEEKLIETDKINIRPGWRDEISSNQVRYEFDREEITASSLQQILTQLYSDIQFNRQTIKGRSLNYISIFLGPATNDSRTGSTKCGRLFSQS